MQLGNQLAVKSYLTDCSIEAFVRPHVARRSGEALALTWILYQHLPEFAVEDAQNALPSTFVTR